MNQIDNIIDVSSRNSNVDIDIKYNFTKSFDDIKYNFTKSSGPNFSKPLYERRAQNSLFRTDVLETSKESKEVLEPIRWKIIILIMVQMVLSPLVFRFLFGVQPAEGTRSWGANLDWLDYLLLVTIWLGKQQYV